MKEKRTTPDRAAPSLTGRQVGGPDSARPVTSLVAILVATAGSIVLGAVLLHAERLRRRG